MPFNNEDLSRFSFKEPTEEERKEKILAKLELTKSGYAGVLPSGEIVDRREHPNATPIQANSMFGVPEPKKL